jgi:hypothetical protein
MSADDSTEEEQEFKDKIDNKVSDHDMLGGLVDGNSTIDFTYVPTLNTDGKSITIRNTDNTTTNPLDGTITYSGTMGTVGTFNNLIFDQHDFELPVTKKDLDKLREHILLLMGEVEELKKALKLTEE